jgi:hypothetical protein
LIFSFHFCTFDDPCTLSVMGFAGGAYFECSLQSDGQRSLKAALEFGGALSFNVVVAKGELHVMAGIYFSLDNDAAVVAAFFRAGGHLEVLALINASVEFLLMLAYRKSQGANTLYGIASLTVSIHLFMFHVDVSVTMEKTFIGSADKNSGQSSSQSHLRHGRERFLLASQSSPAPAPVTAQPLAYFKPCAAVGTVAYRFENEEEWIQQYWSQFAL